MSAWGLSLCLQSITGQSILGLVWESHFSDFGSGIQRLPAAEAKARVWPLTLAGRGDW